MIIKNIVKTEKEPATNCLWLKDNSLYHFSNGKWEQLDSTVIDSDNDSTSTMIILEDNELIYYTTDKNQINIVNWAQGSTPGGSDWAYNPTQHIVSHEYNPDAKYGIITFDTNVIPEGLFISQPTLLKVDMADNIVFIGAEAFCNCTALKEIRLSNTLEAIGYAAFYLDSALESIYIPDSVVDMTKNPDESDTYDHGCQFMNCVSLQHVRLSKNMIRIPGVCFRGCSSLTTVHIPDSVVTISTWAFGVCTNLVNVYIGANLETISSGAFINCYSLKNFIISSTKYTGVSDNLFSNAHLDTFIVPASVSGDRPIFLNASTIDNLLFNANFKAFDAKGKIKGVATIKNIDFPGTSVTDFPGLTNKLETIILRNTTLVTGLDELIPSSIITTKLQIYVPTNLIESYKTTYPYLSDYFFEITGDAFATKKEVESKLQTLSTDINNTTDNKLKTLSDEIAESMEQTTTMLQSNIETLVGDVKGLEHKLGVLQEYHKEPLYTRIYYIIDQRGTISDPDDMVSPNYIMDEDGNLVKISESGATGNPATNLLTWLKVNSHRYVGKYDEAGNCTLKQLDDTNSTKYADGTSALADIEGTSGVETDVWMKLPCDVYYKTEAYTPEGETTPNEDYILVTITTKLLEGENESDWNKHNEYDLIAVFKAYKEANKFYSLSNTIPNTEVNSNDINTYLNNRGSNIKLVSYDIRKLLALLFYGYYSSLDCSSNCGKGTKNIISSNRFPKLTGLTNYLGMTDTTYESGTGSDDISNSIIQAGYGDGVKSINFWGLENCYSDLVESVPNIQVMKLETLKNKLKDTNFSIKYINYFTKTVTTISNIDDIQGINTYQIVVFYNDENIIYKAIFLNSNQFFSYTVLKLLFGDDADIISSKAYTVNKPNYYCTMQNLDCGQNIIGIGIGGSSNDRPSLINIVPISNSYIMCSSRIMYKGTKDTVKIIN